MQDLIKLILEFLKVFTIKTKTKPKQTLEETNQTLKEALTQQGLFFKQTTRRASSLLQELAQATKTIESLRKELQDLKASHRHDVIAALHEGVYFTSEQHRNHSIQIFTKEGNLTNTEIRTLLEATHPHPQETPKKNIIELQKQGKNTFNFIK